jgi:hypothetical protein
MKSFKEYILEARNPLRKEDPYVKREAEDWAILRSASPNDQKKVIDLKVQISELESKIRKTKERLQNLDTAGGDNYNYTKRQYVRELAVMETELYNLKEDLRQETRQAFGQSQRFRKYEPDTNRKINTQIYSKYGMKWYVESINRGKYFIFERMLNKVMQDFYKRLNAVGISKLPSINFFIKPIKNRPGMGTPSGEYARHYIQVDPSRVDFKNEASYTDFIDTLVHEYAHHIYKLLPSEITRPGGLLSQEYTKLLKQFKQNAQPGYKNFFEKTLSSYTPRGKKLRAQLQEYFKHPQGTGYTFTDSEEMFTTSVEYFNDKYMPKRFKQIVKAALKYQ